MRSIPLPPLSLNTVVYKIVLDDLLQALNIQTLKNFRHHYFLLSAIFSIFPITPKAFLHSSPTIIYFIFLIINKLLTQHLKIIP